MSILVSFSLENKRKAFLNIYSTRPTSSSYQDHCHKEAHKTAKKLGYESIVLLGHDKYYPRFGNLQADKFGIRLPSDVPMENCMVIALVNDGLKGVNRTVEYPEEFNTR